MKMPLVSLLSLCLLSTGALGAEPLVSQRLQTVLDQLDIDIDSQSLKPAPIKGFLEVVRGMKVLYVSVDGRLLIDGDVLSLDDRSNITEQRRDETRLELLAGISPHERIIAPASGETHGRITVFVDTNCLYCIKLHKQGAELARRGVEVQYLFYPRSGPASDSFAQAIAVWCAADRLAALDAVMHGSTLPPVACDNPVLQHYELARRLELRGTPAIIFADGTIRYGALPISELLAGK